MALEQHDETSPELIASIRAMKVPQIMNSTDPELSQFATDFHESTGNGRILSMPVDELDSMGQAWSLLAKKCAAEGVEGCRIVNGIWYAPNWKY